jgi:hypothetical protein
MSATSLNIAAREPSSVRQSDLHRRERAAAPSLLPPISCAVSKWCALVRQYLDGDVRAGVRAANSVCRWRQGLFSK